MSASAAGAVLPVTEDLYDIVLNPTSTTTRQAGRADIAPAPAMDSVIIIAVAVIVVLILVLFIRRRRR